MTQHIVSDALIDAMSPAQRRDLIRRLERPLAELLPPPGLFERVRPVRLTLMIGGAIGLIPWIVYLAVTLPDTYVAQNWPTTWVGFDSLLVVFMAATAVFGFLRRQLLIPTAFTTGVLLICDAWFDVMTAGPNDVWSSIMTAAFGALPLAVILIDGTLRLQRQTATRMWLLDPGTRLWRLPLSP
jgi:sterol desaturase/sphingolipid hydroxylase (fatty acid hydroxylase superfamily)